MRLGLQVLLDDRSIEHDGGVDHDGIDHGLDHDGVIRRPERRSTRRSGGGGAPPNGGGRGGGASSSRTTVDGEIPEETNGPFPSDGSNGVNVLTESGIVRSDIRSSFGSSTTTAEGIQVTLNYTVVDVNTGNPVEGLAVYTWHCDREGNYSMYSQAAADENYLRGVQPTGSDGTATFTTIYPACYSGRWPHTHFEVYPSLDQATSADNRLATSQIALPDEYNQAVYATSGYEQSVKNYAQVSLATDGVFSDGVSLETPTVTGDVTNGLHDHPQGAVVCVGRPAAETTSTDRRGRRRRRSGRGRPSGCSGCAGRRRDLHRPWAPGAGAAGPSGCRRTAPPRGPAAARR